MMTYTFSALYKDGKKLTLSDSLSYDNLPRDDIEAFEVTKDSNPFLLMKLDEGKKLIYRKRVEQTAGQKPFTVYLFGWRKNDIQSINYLSEDGRIIQGGKFDENDSWMYAPQLRSFEV